MTGRLHTRMQLFHTQGAVASRLVAAVVLATALPTYAHEFSIEFLAGAAHSFDSRLRVQQTAQPEIAFTAQWETQSFTAPIVWDLRATWMHHQHGMSFELLHHKLYLKNPPATITEFSISHGYNMISLQYRWQPNWYYGIAGVGMVMAHPVNTVRGSKRPESGGWFGAGYELTGPLLTLGAGVQRDLWKSLFLTLEGRVTLSRARVSVVEGKASLHNRAAQLFFGLGSRL